MVKAYKIHKFFGLLAGLLILVLGVTGFFLDHEKWDFLYTTTFKTLPDATKESDKKLFNSYWIDKQDSAHLMTSLNMCGASFKVFHSPL